MTGVVGQVVQRELVAVGQGLFDAGKRRIVKGLHVEHSIVPGFSGDQAKHPTSSSVGFEAIARTELLPALPVVH